MSDTSQPWWKHLNSYPLVSSFCHGPRSRGSSIASTSSSSSSRAARRMEGAAPCGALIPRLFGGYATSIFVAGWATGGLIFGALGGDRVGLVGADAHDFACSSIRCARGTLGGFSAKGGWTFAVLSFSQPASAVGWCLRSRGWRLIADKSARAVRAPARLGRTASALRPSGNVTGGSRRSRPRQTWKAKSFSPRAPPWKYMFLIGSVPAFPLRFSLQARLKGSRRNG